MGTDHEHQAAGSHQGGTSRRASGRSSLFLGLRAPGLRRGGGSGWPAAGRDVTGACLLFESALEAPEGLASFPALPPLPCSRLHAYAAGRYPNGRSVWRFTVPARHHRGCGVGVSVHLCVSVSLGLCCGIVSFLETQLVTPNRPWTRLSGCSLMVSVMELASVLL